MICFFAHAGTQGKATAFGLGHATARCQECGTAATHATCWCPPAWKYWRSHGLSVAMSGSSVLTDLRLVWDIFLLGAHFLGGETWSWSPVKRVKVTATSEHQLWAHGYIQMLRFIFHCPPPFSGPERIPAKVKGEKDGDGIWQITPKSNHLAFLA